MAEAFNIDGPPRREGSGGASSWQLLKDISRIAVPSAAACIFSIITELINTLLIGRVGTHKELAAVGLANMMQNCCSLSIGTGLCFALDTLASQAYGAGEHVLCCHYLQRCRVLATLQLVWMVPLLCNTESLLLFARQDPEVARLAASYNRASVVGLFAFFQDFATRRFLTNRSCTMPPAVLNAAASCLHVGWGILFVWHLNLGNRGLGYANAITWWSSFVLNSAYLARYARQEGLPLRSVLGVQGPGVKALRRYMHTAVPCIVQICSEWWFWEICAGVVGYMGSLALAAHVAVVQLINVFFMLNMGLGAACAAIVGNAMGANMPERAQHAVWICVSVGLVQSGIIAAFLFRGKAGIAEILTHDRDVQPVIQRLLVIYGVELFCDNTQNLMSTACRGLGLQTTATVVYMLAYYAFMLPVGVAMAFPLGLGVDGLWWSTALGTALAAAIFTTLLCRTRFADLAKEASARMEEEGATARGLSRGVDWGDKTSTPN